MVNKLKENTTYQNSLIYMAILVKFDGEKKIIVDKNTENMNNVLEKVVEKANK